MNCVLNHQVVFIAVGVVFVSYSGNENFNIQTTVSRSITSISSCSRRERYF